MNTRDEYFSSVCEKFNSEPLHNDEEQLLLLPFNKGPFSLFFIMPMQSHKREYDLEIERDGEVVFADFADLPSLDDEPEDELEQMFRSEVTASIKELLELDFSIEDGEIIFL
ncbi:MAG: hypothetical protein HRU20_15480 [Pseudomonadales bacterium]|nr:hypothetical protein [Pseudomonadales bacterium]